MLHVTTEIGRLRRVLLHEPGPEVDRMVPALMEELLFDDILYGDRARDEHARFRRVLQLLGVETIDAGDLLREVLGLERARRWVVDDLFADLDPDDRSTLGAMDATELARTLVTGSRTKARPAGVAIEDIYQIPPLPNWCFQRDPQIVLGDGVIFGAMAAAARHREALLSRVIFRFHPELAGVPVIFDPLEADRERTRYLDPQRSTIEGGDVLLLSEELIAVGISERTNEVAARQLARTLARRERGPRWMLLVEIPRRRAYMHLDTLFTPIDHDACLAHAPVLLEGARETIQVAEIDLHGDALTPRPVDGLLSQLAARGLDWRPIPCGGDDPIAQRREQWTDGANALAVAPGVITIYDRNVRTAEALDAAGYRVVSAEDLLLGRAEVDLDDGGRVCVMISSHEISRARGGPHCLTHPLVRDDVERRQPA